MAKYWLHVEDGLVMAALVAGRMTREQEAQTLGEWLMDGLTPALHDLGDVPLQLFGPVPVNPQRELPL